MDMMTRALLALVLSFLVLLLIFAAATINAVYGQTPMAIIAPNGAITYVYPGTPSIIIAPNGGVSYAYPPIPAPPSVPVIPPIGVPLVLPSLSFDGGTK